MPLNWRRERPISVRAVHTTRPPRSQRGARAGGGIGCHTMALWMDRANESYTHMGGEGANWIGEAPFSTRDHVFQNLGDGTYNHSGLMAIRFAKAAGTTITYKILYNDAVAMTGGQQNEGDLSADQICRELLAIKVKNVAVVYGSKEEIDFTSFPSGLTWHTREELPEVQEKFSKIKGVSAIVYIQTCAAEKRRRRKRGTFPDPDKRIFINTDVCEGCGDCGEQSNCVSIVPVETELGRKRAIDQSSCNKDFSCVDGFCPSFVTIEGAQIRKEATSAVEVPDLPLPDLPTIEDTHNVVIAGVGGTGVVTIGAVMAMAAHLDGKGAGMMEMAGLAQQGGAVHIHCRIAELPEDISAIRVATGECDTLIGGDLVVSAGAKTLGLLRAGSAIAVVNSHEIITGDFTRDRDFRLPMDQLHLSVQARLRDRLSSFDASELARVLMGDSIYANMMVFGAAWQAGGVPIGLSAVRRAIKLNGTAVERNLAAFEFGRWAIAYPEEAEKALVPAVLDLPKTTEQMITFRADHLKDFQNAVLAQKYRDMVAKFEGTALHVAVAKGYHKLLAYKDEYEVARLLLDTRSKARATFDGDIKLTYNLAPPLLSRMGANGRPVKWAFGGWMGRVFPILARLKGLRGTPFDPFGYTEERKMERALIAQYEVDMSEVLALPEGYDTDAAVALAGLPLQILGFGPVKDAAVRRAAKRREELLSVLRAGSVQVPAE